MWAWADSIRWIRLDCNPVISADMKTMTATPSATPATMNNVCSRPSRRKRMATIHSKGSQCVNIPWRCQEPTWAPLPVPRAPDPRR